MFHFDCTMEDVRIVAAEHRVPLDEEEMSARERNIKFEPDHPFPKDKHDGTFDVMHIDGTTGRTHTINLTMEELAIVIHLGMVGDESAAHLYDTVQIKRYQELMKDYPAMSFIP